MKLNNIKLILSVIILTSIILTLSANSEVIKLKYTSLLEKGFSKEECKEVLKGDIDKTLQYEADNKRDEFEIQIITIDKSHLNTRYILLFRNDTLEFWGFPHEFARHDNYLYNAVADFCVEEFKKLDEIVEMSRVDNMRAEKKSRGIID